MPVQIRPRTVLALRCIASALLVAGVAGGAIPKFFENCTYWLEARPYVNQWQNNPTLHKNMQRLYEEFDLTCRPKPEGPIGDHGIVDPTLAIAELEKMTEADWLAEPFRQQAFKVHAETQSLVLLWKNDFFDQIQQLPAWAKWESLLEPAIDRFVLDKNYSREDVDIWKAMLARIPAGRVIKSHKDTGPALAFVHRVHWVLASGDAVKWSIGPRDKLTGDYLGPGRVFELNNVLLHKIVNDGKTDRVHVVIDMVQKKMAGFKRVEVPLLRTGKDEL